MHSEGLAKFSVHYMFFGTSKIFFGHMSLGKYQISLFPHPCFRWSRLTFSNLYFICDPEDFSLSEGNNADSSEIQPLVLV